MSPAFRGDFPSVRTLLLILVAPVLLMPPGMCICQFVPCGEVGRGDPVASGESEAASVCTCSHTDGGANAELPCGCPAGGGKPRPLPGKPWPDCPVVTGTAPDKFTTPSPVLLALDPAAVVLWVVEVPVVPAGRTHQVSPRLASPPLFISQCSLVI